jgi:RNA polymerase sigma-70 factor (ECF subfamily)
MTATLSITKDTDNVGPWPRTGQPADATLLSDVLAGDKEACARLVDQHSGRMLAVARRFLRCEEDCADAVQDAFLSAFRSLNSFKGNAQLGTWLHRIVTNVCLMKLRSQSRRHGVPLDDLLPTFNDVRPSELADHSLDRAETQARVRACIEQLPDSYRKVVLLRDIEECDTDQTARLLGITPAAVKTRLHRARQALRAMLEPFVTRMEAE